MSSSNQTSAYPSSASIQMGPVKNDTINTGLLLQRDVSSVAERSLADQRVGRNFQTPLHAGTNPPINTFTPRNTATVKQRQESAFQQRLSGQDNQPKISPQNLHNSQKPMQSESSNVYRRQSSNVIIPRPSTLSTSHSCTYNHMK